MAPVLLQINCTANWGSTGKIVEQINIQALKKGWDTYIAYGRNSNQSRSHLVRVGTDFDVYKHYAEHLFTDNDGLASRRVTKQLIKRIEEIKPSIIHLHNIHDHWLNYQILFDYLKHLDVPIVWTQHDCWGFTGGCCYFSQNKCSQWKTACTRDCPARNSNVFRSFINHAEEQYRLKKQLFLESKNITIITVSKWLESIVIESFLKGQRIETIPNGVDTDVFRPLYKDSETLNKYGLENTKYVMGVAAVWEKRKGFEDYCKLAAKIPTGVKIVLLGLNQRKKQDAEKYGIIGIPRTNNIEELVELYNGASVVLNLSYEETFGMTTVEGLACGTPGIVYNATASPELITPETGMVIDPGDIDGVAAAIKQLLNKEKPIKACRERAVIEYEKNKCFEKYLNLYEELLAK